MAQGIFCCFLFVRLNLLEDKPPRTVVAEPPSMDITKA